MKSDIIQIAMGVLIFLALAFSVGSVTWCETAGFTLTGPLGNRDISFGLWRYNSFVVIGSSSGDLWKVDTCNAYPDDVEKDSYWKAAQAFSIIAPIFGAFSFCPLLVVRSNPSMAKLVGVLLLLTTLFQGLTLLVLQSELCNADENPFFNEFPVLQAAGALTTEDKCSIGRSAIVSIVSMCLWFVAAVVALVIPVEPTE